jgi:dienelactone hydrolase
VRARRSALPSPPTAGPAAPAFPVGERTFTFVDHSRTIRLAHRRRVPRTLVTIVRYPAAGRASSRDLIGAPPATGVFPLIVFGHGFAVTPAPYARLLDAWAAAGYVVAAPIFPLENANAPGGPDENDLVNQPRDMSFVISSMLAGPLTTNIDGQEIAVAGQSDGGETAFAVAYDRPFMDSRIGAAVILSGAQLPGAAFRFSAPSPPLLASQGTADVINLPMYTYQFFNKAPRPKYLLKLLGAPHLPPYTYKQPQLGIVERVTIAFLDLYLKHSPTAQARLAADGNVPRTARLIADR